MDKLERLISAAISVCMYFIHDINPLYKTNLSLVQPFSTLQSMIKCLKGKPSLRKCTIAFGISRNTNFKYSSHRSSLVLDCSHTSYTV